MKKIVVSLCGTLNDMSNCPTVEFEEKEVRIGEEGNLATLKASEWNKLVDLIKSEKLKKV